MSVPILIYPSLPSGVAMTPSTPYEPSGSWDSIHVFEAAERGRQAHYKLTSTIMLQLVTRKGSAEAEGTGTEKTHTPGDSRGEKKGADGWKREGEVSLSGSMTRQVSFGVLCSYFGSYVLCWMTLKSISLVMWPLHLVVLNGS